MSNTIQGVHNQYQELFPGGLKDVETKRTAQTGSNVDHPAHYNQGGIECIDALRAALTPEEFRGFCKGNALKYIWRERTKGGAESLAKAQWYLEELKK